jgi:phosphatidylglycerophosphate synthase
MSTSLSNQISAGIGWTRDRLAGRLVRARVTPNVLTLIGLAITLAAAVCLGIGLALPGSDVPPLFARAGQANWWLWLTAALLILAGACDVLDGAVARVGRLASETGAFLDSTLDRFSDMAMFIAMAAGYAWSGNFTLMLLAMLAMSHAVMISYTRARAEDLVAHCKVGYWERGERVTAVVIAVACYQMPAVLWMLATLPLLTATRRIVYTLGVLAYRRRTGVDLSATDTKPVGRGVYRLALWRYPRGTIAYDIVTGLNILWILLAPITSTFDPIRAWFT